MSEAVIRLRPARPVDAIDVFTWRSDPESRRFLPSFDVPFTFDRHVVWFTDRVQRPEIWIAELADSGTPIGVLRVDLGEDRRRFVSLLVAPAFRGRGFGLVMLRSSVLRGDLWAKIHAFNSPSLAVFAAAGFMPAHTAGVWTFSERPA